MQLHIAQLEAQLIDAKSKLDTIEKRELDRRHADEKRFAEEISNLEKINAQFKVRIMKTMPIQLVDIYEQM